MMKPRKAKLWVNISSATKSMAIVPTIGSSFIILGAKISKGRPTVAVFCCKSLRLVFAVGISLSHPA
jgi:hypothetical protein